MKRSLVLEIIYSLLAILFVYASISKLLDNVTFRVQLSKSPYKFSFGYGLTIFKHRHILWIEISYLHILLLKGGCKGGVNNALSVHNFK